MLNTHYHHSRRAGGVVTFIYYQVPIKFIYPGVILNYKHYLNVSRGLIYFIPKVFLFFFFFFCCYSEQLLFPISFGWLLFCVSYLGIFTSTLKTVFTLSMKDPQDHFRVTILAVLETISISSILLPKADFAGTYFSEILISIILPNNYYNKSLEAATEGVLRNFVKFTGNHLCQNLFSNEVAGLSLQLY